MTAAVEAASVAYTYPGGRTGLEEASLVAAPGEAVAILGPNGSGKSTLLRILATDLRPDRGDLKLFGVPARGRLPRLRRCRGWAPDEAAHLEPLSGLENAVLFGRLAGMSRSRARAEALALLGRFDLLEDAEAPVAGWSFGMRRKLVLIEALLHEPGLLLLDEPTLGLDPPSLATLRRLLRERREGGTAVVVATNDPHEARRVAGRVLFLHRGKVVLEGDPDALLEDLGASTRIEVEVEGGASPASLELPGATAVEMSPQRIVVATRDGDRALPRLLDALLDAGLTVRSLRVREPHLGDVFRRFADADLPDGESES